jgi:TolB-like protein
MQDERVRIIPRVWEKTREHATNAIIGGGILVLTGFTPEHWVADVLQRLHLSNVRSFWPTFLDGRLLVLSAGVAIIVGDLLWRKHRLSLIGETVPVVEPAAREPGARTVALSSQPLPDKPSIAVLPFSNLSGDVEDDYFAEGIAEEILTALSHCPALFVIARNSSFTYRGREVDIRDVGRDLGVRYVLQGSVRRGGNTLRFAAQLIDAGSATHIWADRFEGDVTDVFALQDRLTASVVAAIEPNLQRAELDRVKGKPAANLDAYDHLLRAQQLEYEFTRDSLVRALVHLKRALALDPDYAPAMALAAYCCAECRTQGWCNDAEAESAEGVRLARRAVAISKDNANVLWMAAYTLRQLTTDQQAAHDLIYQSLSINPNSAMALTVAGWIEFAVGHSEKAIEQFLRAERLSPRDPKGWFIVGGLSVAYYLSDQNEAAVAAALRALRDNPRFTIALRMLAAANARLGHPDEASAAVHELRKIDPQLTVSLWKAGRHAMAFSGSVQDKIGEGLLLAGLPA